MKEALNVNIQTLRNARSMSQVALAQALNVSKQCVSNWENDNVQPSIEMLEKLADFFHVSTDYLLGRDDKKYMDVSGLSEEQVGHITMIIQDIYNNKKSRA